MLNKVLRGRYQVFQALGSGGFGQTYLARDLHRPAYPKCVVKHLKPNTDNTKFLNTAKRLFHSEAAILEQLGNHDQIPQLLAYFEEDQDLFLVQELIEGYSLETELLATPRWTEDQVVQLLRQVLEILEFIHAHQVIHRDINPSNLIRRQQDSKLVLIDFGAVKQIQTQLQSPQEQVSRTVMIGTPGYISREQSIGQPRLNSDIYSLGMIAIQALTGLHPSQLERDPYTEEIVWLHHVTISSGLTDVLSRMVLSNFRHRYGSATEVLDALRQFDRATNASMQPVKAPPPPRSVQDSISNVTPSNSSKVSSNPNVSSNTNVSSTPSTASGRLFDRACNEQFIRQCERDLTEFVGPIAGFIVQKAIKTYPDISRLDFVRIVSAEISDNPQTALKFQQRILSEIV
jgi:serine/threonine protein kinase